MIVLGICTLVGGLLVYNTDKPYIPDTLYHVYDKQGFLLHISSKFNFAIVERPRKFNNNFAILYHHDKTYSWDVDHKICKLTYRPNTLRVMNENDHYFDYHISDSFCSDICRYLGLPVMNAHDQDFRIVSITTTDSISNIIAKFSKLNCLNEK